MTSLSLPTGAVQPDAADPSSRDKASQALVVVSEGPGEAGGESGSTEAGRTSPPADTPPPGAMVVHAGVGQPEANVVDVASSSASSGAPSDTRNSSPAKEDLLVTGEGTSSTRKVFPELEDVVPAAGRRAEPRSESLGDVYFPDWKVLNSDELSSARTARHVIDHAAPPLSALEVQRFPDRQIWDDLCRCLAYTMAYTSESLFRWGDQIRMADAHKLHAEVWKERVATRDRELDEVEGKLAEVLQAGEDREKHVSVLEQDVADLRATSSSQASEIKRLEVALLEAVSRSVLREGQEIEESGTVIRLSNQVDVLKTEVVGLQNSLSLKNGEVAREKAASVDRAARLEQEKEVLRREAEEARAGYQWVIEHGLKEFVTNLHRSFEFLSSRTRICEAARAVGYAEGVREGFRAVHTKTPLAHVRSFDPSAADRYDGILIAESSGEFPYLNALAAYAGQPIEDLRKIRPASPSLE